MANLERESLWEERVAQWRKSGQSQRAFAESQGYPQRQLNYWARRLAAPGQFGGGTAARAGMKLQVELVRLATRPVDMRIGVDGLSLLVQQVLGCPPCDGTAYVFSNRRRTRLKLVCWDGNGVWLCLRRLHRGQFVWPQADDATWQMSDEQWQWLIAGVDWQRLAAPAPGYWQL